MPSVTEMIVVAGAVAGAVVGAVVLLIACVLLLLITDRDVGIAQ